jgi:PhzF family phenazine biosynthesis protein
MATSYTLLKASLVPLAYSIEHASYPDDEEASLESLTYRQANAGEFFVGAFSAEDKLQGYICSTRCASFDHDSLSTHVPDAPILAIHSVCVDAQYRNQKVATKMLRYYTQMVANAHPTVKTIKLMAKQALVAFYVSCGFTCNGLSPILHGAERWFDLSLDLTLLRKPQFVVVNAFSTSAGCGNPAAVVNLSAAAHTYTSEWMQRLAFDFNLSETVFIIPSSDGSHYNLRYFTPTAEVGLCGHATLSAAAYIYENGHEPKDKAITFVTINAVELKASFTDGSIELTFPPNPPIPVSGDTSIKLGIVVYSGFKVDSSGVIAMYTTTNENGVQDAFVELTEDAFNRIGSVNLDALTQTDIYAHGIILCSTCSTPGVDFQSRFFAPKVGIDEDPVCGRAHCSLAPYFANAAKLNKTELRGFQASKRTGVVDCAVGDGVVKLSGKFVFTMEGQILV